MTGHQSFPHFWPFGAKRRLRRRDGVELPALSEVEG
jgi:hypothetical protein